MTFNVNNNSETLLSGVATVASPFSVVSGGNYELAPNGNQTVTVRYSPTTGESDSAGILFTGYNGATAKVQGRGYVAPQYLSIANNNGNIKMSWPSAPTGFILQSSPDMNTWTTASATPTIQNGQNQVTMPISGVAPTFYRLFYRQPPQ